MLWTEGLATWRGGGYFSPRLGAAYKFVTFCDDALTVTYEKLASWQTKGRGGDRR